MTMRMLIDARHREETRVAVVNGHRIEEFDFESAERKQLKGNIYLAKVTRVEPSLQAAFVDYGGNRHGFLAFSEIHPDYYQIPKEDRDALLAEEAAHAAEVERLRGSDHDDDDQDEDDHHDDVIERTDVHDDDEDDDALGEDGEPVAKRQPLEGGAGDDHAVDNLREKRTNLRHRYKIQDVIRRRQVLLVQVVKEERGNKGAALTTYLSLAGRYCVLMPNTSHGGGISRKISNGADRKRLKSIMADLALPSTMGCIVRTAGLQRTRNEIKRDFDYLARLWDEIRENTLKSAAPALVYGDSDLIKRAIRDIYNREIEEVIVEGEEGYRQARQYMKLLSPAAAKKVKLYIDTVPLFQRGGVEEQLSAMYNPVVQLKSGGYLVINPTEALVSIDINSGRSTREHNIEQTALMTNLEAAHEIARQLRLRDMAGLVVIDFIDMESNGNNRKVERAMKEALKNDRARIQVGRISSFGLFEMSRQRIRTGVLEASTRPCPHCEGTGFVRTASSAGLSALRLIEDEAARGRGSLLTIRASAEASFYLLNRKRAELAEIEDRYGVSIEVIADGEQEGARMSVEASGPPPAHPPRFDAPIIEVDEEDFVEEEEDEIEAEEVDEADDADEGEAREERDRPGETAAEGDARRKRRRRRGRRGRNRPEGEPQGEPAEQGDTAEVAEADTVADADEGPAEVVETAEAGEGEGRRRRGRRGRRGGRRNEGEANAAAEAEAPAGTLLGDVTEGSVEAEALAESTPEPVAEVAAAAEDADAPKKKSRRRKVAADAAPAEAVAAPEAPVVEAAPEPEAEKPKRKRRTKAEMAAAEAPVVAAPVADEPKKRRAPRRKATEEAAVEATPAAPVAAAEPAPEAETAAPTAIDPDPGEAGTPRRGWWQRTFGA